MRNMTEIEKIKEELAATKIELEALKGILGIKEICTESGKTYYCQFPSYTSFEDLKSISDVLKEMLGISLNVKFL